MNPRARQDDLVVHALDDEIVIYDERSSHAHRLSRTAALIWSRCDGRRSIADLAALLSQDSAAPDRPAVDLQVAEDLVWIALNRLEQEGLLLEKLVRPEEAVRVTRRDALRKAALIGGITLLIPVVQTLVAPTPAMALSVGCAGRGQIPSPTRPCCLGLEAINGICVGHTGQG